MTPERVRRPGRSWSLGLWAAYWLAIFVATHRPFAGGLGWPVPGLDKAIHCGLFFILTLLGGWHQYAMGRALTLRLLIAWAGVYAAYGAVDEWLQQFVGRTASWGDWLADLVGIILGTGVLVWCGGPRRREGEPL